MANGVFDSQPAPAAAPDLGPARAGGGSVHPPSEPPPGGSPRKKRRWWLWIVLFAMLPLVALVTVFGIDRAASSDQILRGVTVGGLPLEGLDRQRAAGAMGILDVQLRGSPLKVSVSGQQFELRSEQLELRLDTNAMTEAAFAAGRTGGLFQQLSWWLQRWFSPADLTIISSLDEAKLERVLVAWEREAIEDPPFEGAIVVREGKPVADYPRPGRAVDRAAAEVVLLAAFSSQQQAVVELPLSQADPRRDREIVDDALQRARKLVGAPVELSCEIPKKAVQPKEGKSKKPKRSKRPSRPAKKDEQEDESVSQTETFKWVVTGAELASTLRSKLGQGDDLSIELNFAATEVDKLLAKVRSRLEQPPQDAQFVIEKRDKIRIEPGRRGTLVDAEAVTAALTRAARSADRQGQLPIELGAEPKLTTERAEQLQIETLVVKYTTYHPCCRPRVKNIHRIADLVDGTLLEPGEVFSLNQRVGRRTRKNGFVPAPSIEEGEMVDTIGGGISQFATTMFNAAYRGGYAIIERAPHTFFFSRYPIGLDATLSYPKPDLIFRNDTETGLLVKTEYTPVSITVKLYGKKDGRKIRWRRSQIADLVKPPIERTANDELDPEEEKVKFRGADGWTVHVSRTVTFADGTSKKARRKITYNPRPREIEVHSCKIPEGEEGYTGEQCPEPEQDGGAPDSGSTTSKAADAGKSSGSAADLIPRGLVKKKGDGGNSR